MPDKIDTIIKTREQAAKIVADAISNIEGKSEVEVHDLILKKTLDYPNLFPKGWYDPPFAGIAVLIDQRPFKRLAFNSMRNPVYWPNDNSKFLKDSIAIIYLSPVDRGSKMIGDIAFTIYNGKDEKIKKHIKNCYNTILSIAEHAQVGMKFSELYKFAVNSFESGMKLIGEMTTSSDPNLGVNLGHTLPGSYENLNFGNTFEEIRETIRAKRIYINEVESFVIPSTCAFTVEVRLEDLNDLDLPKAYFHFIVVFKDGKKQILKNFENIFKIANIDYI